MGSSGNNFLQVVAKNFDVLALYASIRAIETKSRTDDQQWLTYWVLYSMLTLFELTFATVLELPLVALVFPLYASIRAIETRSRSDDQQWLTYWVLYSMLTLFELTFAKVLELFPIWPYAKLILSCWLVLPHFNGAAYVYRNFIRPFYRDPTTCQIWYVPRKKSVFKKPDDVLTAAENYIQEHGTEAFENLIATSKAEREARTRRGNNYMIFDDDYIY